jgi:hypothetical protein
MNLRPVLFLALAATAVATLSLAQPKPAAAPDPVLGNWRIKTGSFYGGCTITGAIAIRATATANRYTCRFNTRQACPGARDATSEQTCTVTRSGDQVTISSTLVSTNAPGYVPDNWRLKVIDASRLEGDLAVYHPPNRPPMPPEVVTSATFFRNQTPIS